MKKSRILVSFILIMGGVALSGCTRTPDKIDPFLWVKVMPADGRVSVQCWLNDSTLLYQGGKFGLFKLMRAEGEGEFEALRELGPTTPLYATWCWTDSTVENGKEYRYYVQAIFAIFEDPDAEGYSDTFAVTPQAGLEDPRPSAPDSLRNDLLVEGSDEVTLRWVPPENHDDFYYIFLSEGALDFLIYLYNFDGTGREWDPSGNQTDPVELDTPVYTFLCYQDGYTRYYMVTAFVDSVMSYPSDVLEIKHTWEE
ncbi:hypothetical protein JXM67_04890 [candidate division WOR-3 bacterium]|nr:hypothetical protein [candidate division WOR-3 bacterium]